MRLLTQLVLPVLAIGFGARTSPSAPRETDVSPVIKQSPLSHTPSIWAREKETRQRQGVD